MITAGRIDRVDRQRAPANLRAGIWRPATPWAIGSTALLQSRRRNESSARLPQTSIAGCGSELHRTFAEFLWAFALSIIFMYIILAMNYESLIHPLIDDHLAVAAADCPLCPAVALGDEQYAQPLLGPGNSRSLRRGEEKLHPANRPHELAPRRRRRSTFPPRSSRGNRDRLASRS